MPRDGLGRAPAQSADRPKAKEIPVQPEYQETLQIFLLQFRQLGPAGKQPPDWEGNNTMLFGYLGLIQSLPNGSGNDFRGFLERILWKGHASPSHAMRLATVFLNPFKMQLGIPPLHGEKGTGFIFFSKPSS